MSNNFYQLNLDNGLDLRSISNFISHYNLKIRDIYEKKALMILLRQVFPRFEPNITVLRLCHARSQLGWKHVIKTCLIFVKLKVFALNLTYGEERLYPETIALLYVLAVERKRTVNFEIHSIYDKRIPNKDFNRQFYLASLVAGETATVFKTQVSGSYINCAQLDLLRHFYRTYCVQSRKRRNMDLTFHLGINMRIDSFLDSLEFKLGKYFSNDTV